MSELLDRIQREIHERLEASRAAVREHERLEAALNALGDAGSRATRAVTARGDNARSSSRSARPSSSSRKPAGAAARSSKRAAPGGARRAASDGAAPTRKRAAPGANREAVLRVLGERPGVTARELAAASQVTGGTLYTILRRLVQEGPLEKRELPGGQTGYAIAASAVSAPQPATTTGPDTTDERA